MAIFMTNYFKKWKKYEFYGWNSLIFLTSQYLTSSEDVYSPSTMKILFDPNIHKKVRH